MDILTGLYYIAAYMVTSGFGLVLAGVLAGLLFIAIILHRFV